MPGCPGILYLFSAQICHCWTIDTRDQWLLALHPGDHNWLVYLVLESVRTTKVLPVPARSTTYNKTRVILRPSEKFDTSGSSIKNGKSPKYYMPTFHPIAQNTDDSEGLRFPSRPKASIFKVEMRTKCNICGGAAECPLASWLQLW